MKLEAQNGLTVSYCNSSIVHKLMRIRIHDILHYKREISNYTQGSSKYIQLTGQLAILIYCDTMG